jgi:hypothetical protein
VERALLMLSLVLIATLAGCGGDGGSSEATTTAAAELQTCNINGRQQQLGASYVTTIQVAKLSCAQAERVVIAYHHCRRRNGGAGGRCNRPVLGFECTEDQRQAVPGVQFNATAECRKGDAEIKSAYTQNF